MKFLLTTFLALLSSLSAHAIIIEDSEDRLVFDLTWNAPAFYGIILRGTDTGSGGSEVHVLGGMSANPFSNIIEVHRVVNGVALPWWTFFLVFQGWAMEQPSHPPDPVWTTATGPHIGTIPADHLFAVEGNDHAVRVVIGALPVPEGNGPWDAAIMLTFAGALLIGMMIGKCDES